MYNQQISWLISSRKDNHKNYWQFSWYSWTSIYILNWSKMVVLIAKSTYIEVWIPIDLHVKWFNWSMTFQKELQKLDKPSELHITGLIGQWPFPKNSRTSWRPKTECQLEQNLAKWGGSYCEVKLKSSVSFLWIEFEHVDCHSSAYALLKTKSQKSCKTGKKVLLLIRTWIRFTYFVLRTQIWYTYFA
jgi:hypothetical protein